MKRNGVGRISWLLLFVLLVGMACSLGTPTPYSSGDSAGNQAGGNNSGNTGGQYTDVTPEPVAQEEVILDNQPTGDVTGSPTAAATFTLNQPYTITFIRTCHWNNGQGAPPGQIGLTGEDGATYGPWQAFGIAASGGQEDTYWGVQPEALIPAGTFTITDSDTSTWCQNETTGGAGSATVQGIPGGETAGAQGGQNTGTTSGNPGSGETTTGDTRGQLLVTLKISGQVHLPDGSPIQAGDLKVMTLTNLDGVSSDGAYVTQTIHTSQAPVLAMAVNAQDEVVLLGVANSSGSDTTLDLSADSTAQALALFDPAFLMMPAYYTQAEQVITGLPGYAGLVVAVEEALKSDPQTPLDDQAHPELYGLASELTGQALKAVGMDNLAQSASAYWLASYPDSGANPAGGAGRKPLLLPNPVVSHPADKPMLAIEDDASHKSPVVLVNHTWTYYKVTIQKDGKPWNNTDQQPIWLVRNNLYGTVNFEWPPVSYRSLASPDVGDGNLTFNLATDKGMIVADLFATTASTILGVGGFASKDKQVAFLLNLKGRYADGIKDLMQAMGQNKTLGWAGAAANYSWVMIWHGGNLLLEIGEMMAKEELQTAVQEGFAKKVAAFILKKLAAPASIAYGGVDAVAMIYSYYNAPETQTFQGWQAYGIYPAVQLGFYPQSVQGKPGDEFALMPQAKGVPADITDLQFELDYGDGSQGEMKPAKADGEQWDRIFQHKFTNAGTFTVTATLTGMVAGQRATVARADLPASLSQDFVPTKNGKWVLTSIEPQDGKPYVDDPQNCYSEPSFGDNAFSETFGCKETSYSYGYDVTVSASWSGLDNAYDPGDTLTISASVSTQAQGTSDYYSELSISAPDGGFTLQNNDSKTLAVKFPVNPEPGATLRISISATRGASVGDLHGASESRNFVYTFQP